MIPELVGEVVLHHVVVPVVLPYVHILLLLCGIGGTACL